MSQTLALAPVTLRPNRGPHRPLFGPMRLRRPAFGRRRAMAGTTTDGDTGSWTLTWHDARDFLMAYTACAVAVAMFMA